MARSARTVGGSEYSLSLSCFETVASFTKKPKTELRALKGGFVAFQTVCEQIYSLGDIFVNGWEIACLDSEECTQISSSINQLET